jgi:hypothetical protein
MRRILLLLAESIPALMALSTSCSMVPWALIPEQKARDIKALLILNLYFYTWCLDARVIYSMKNMQQREIECSLAESIPTKFVKQESRKDTFKEF